MRISQETKNKWIRFRKNKRAFYSLVILVVAYLASLTSPWT
ncbi:MAG TPA: ABC transporter permease, partial [Fibrobacteraceae bacterium]|nr:ABC transporter permease [Fibrobacteraceae bacterium]